MVKYSLDDTFAALAHSTRREILSRLARSDASVGELAAPFGVSLPAILKHVGVLESAGLVRLEKRGRVQHCRLAARPLQRAGQWIDRYRGFWDTQFDALERYLEETPEKEGKP